MRLAILGVTSWILTAAVACGGGDRTQQLIDKLPSLVLTPDEVAAQIPPGIEQDVFTDVSEFSSNEEATSGYIYYGRDIEALEAAGRVTGYSATYAVGPPGPPQARFRCCSGVGVTVNLYRNEALAQAAVETRPFSATGYGFPVRQIGDAAAAWPLYGGGFGEAFNVDTRCPCFVVFRVGPLFGSVSIGQDGHGPPSVTEEVDSRVIGLAEATAARFRAALQD